MVRPSRNDIRESARGFAHEWEAETRERGEAQSFWTDFLLIFGIQRRRVNAAFERHARRTSTGGGGFIDLLWPGMLLAEHKSAGADLNAAMSQALDYVESLPEQDAPRLIVVSDFARIQVLDLEDETPEAFEFPLRELPREVDRFLVLAGYTSLKFETEDAVNVEAAELLGSVYDEIDATGYSDHSLRVFIVRVLFLLFGDDTGLWPRQQFADLLRNRTADDGSDLGMWLGRLFSVLNTCEDQRTTALDEDLAAFPYVNGGLYQESIEPPDTTRAMRDRLLKASAFDWSKISPAVFGSMFQSVMDPVARRHLGAHYTSEPNIFKVIRPLFLNDLEAELAAATSTTRLRAFHRKLGELRFLDPACGCGNFLVIAYRELRRLERETLLKLHPQNVQMTTELQEWRAVSLDQFYGIELEEFPVRIAETAIYLVDHLENEALGASFGVNIADLPLTESAEIRWANALETPWEEVLGPLKCAFLLGNPPYGGKHLLDDQQKVDLAGVFSDHPQGGTVDYVSGWFKLAANYLAAGDGSIKGAFVATNSVTQGEQVPALWPALHQAGLHINFAWRTFDWTSEGRHSAHVHVVIVGFVHSQGPVAGTIYEFDAETDTSVARETSTINGYLVAFDETYPTARTKPLANVLPVMYGSKPTDQGHLLLTNEEATEVRETDPVAAKYIRPLLSTEEFLAGVDRFCFWLEDAAPEEIRLSPILLARLDAVKLFREGSKKVQTREKAAEPGLFAEIRTPMNDFIFIPLHSSGDRRLIPMGFVSARASAIVHNSGSFVEDADLVLFGLLQSEMFSTWQRVVGGRIKSDYRFNNRLVYNTFPFPDPSSRQRVRIEEAVEKVLEARDAHASASLADLYDPRVTPRDLAEAHRELDRAVDLAFGRRSRLGEAERMAFLFDEYVRVLEADQLTVSSSRRRRR
ncbi:MAG TPA: DNA methyltransferase [Solirubrobacterales bacterium]|jgi:hypothetical protein